MALSSSRYFSNSPSGGDSTKTPSGGGGGGKVTKGGAGGDKGSGDKKDGWLCPNCGQLCSHIDMFICKCCLCHITEKKVKGTFNILLKSKFVDYNSH